MAETEPKPFPVIREAVASFPDRAAFPPRRLGPAGRRVRPDRSVGARLAPAARGGRRRAGQADRRGADRGAEIHRAADGRRDRAAVGRTDRGDGGGAGRSRARRRGAEGNIRRLHGAAAPRRIRRRAQRRRRAALGALRRPGPRSARRSHPGRSQAAGTSTSTAGRNAPRRPAESPSASRAEPNPPLVRLRPEHLQLPRDIE